MVSTAITLKIIFWIMSGFAGWWCSSKTITGGTLLFLASLFCKTFREARFVTTLRSLLFDTTLLSFGEAWFDATLLSFCEARFVPTFSLLLTSLLDFFFLKVFFEYRKKRTDQMDNLIDGQFVNEVRCIRMNVLDPFIHNFIIVSIHKN